MVEAGASEVPEERILEALEIAHAEIVKLCEAQEDLRRQAGKSKWLDLELTAEIERDHGNAIWQLIQQVGIRESAAIVDELLVLSRADSIRGPIHTMISEASTG